MFVPGQRVKIVGLPAKFNGNWGEDDWPLSNGMEVTIRSIDYNPIDWGLWAQKLNCSRVFADIESPFGEDYDPWIPVDFLEALPGCGA